MGTCSATDKICANAQCTGSCSLPRRHAGPAPHAACRCSRLDARCLRRNAVRDGHRLHHARPRHYQSAGRTAEHADVARIRHWRRAFRIHRRSRRTRTCADVQHSDVLGLFFCVGIFYFPADARLLSLSSRARHGRRMEYRSDSGRGNLAERTARTRSFSRPKLVGDRLCGCCAGQWNCSAQVQLARRLLRRNSARIRHALDSQRRTGAGTLEDESHAGTARQEWLCGTVFSAISALHARASMS